MEAKPKAECLAANEGKSSKVEKEAGNGVCL